MGEVLHGVVVAVVFIVVWFIAAVLIVDLLRRGLDRVWPDRVLQLDSAWGASTHVLLVIAAYFLAPGLVAWYVVRLTVG